MEEIQRLNRLRGTAKRKLTNFITFLKVFKNADGTELATATNAQIKELRIRVEQFESLLNEFEEVQLQIECTCTDADLEGNFGERDQFVNSYLKNLSIAKTLWDKFTGSTEAVTSTKVIDEDNQSQCSGTGRNDFDNQSQCSGTSRNNDQFQHIKLPTISLPTFKGNYNSWLEYKDTFQSLIHENPSINAIQKYHYLRASLEGDAMKVIQSLEFSGNNYNSAWDLLCSRYNNPRLLVHNHLKALFDIESLNKETAIGLRNIIDKVSEHLRALETLKQPTQHWDTLIIFIIAMKLDKSTAREWERQKVTNEYPKLEDFTKFLRARADLLETLEINLGIKTYCPKEQQGSRPPIRRASLVAANPTCNFCQEGHTIYNCSNFLKLPVLERLEKVKQLQLCPNCLWTGHELSKCRSRPCKKCRLKHNSLLHHERSLQSDEGASRPQSDTQIALSSYTSEKAVLLSTVVLSVYDSKGNKHEARALLDSGSQSNFITSSLCKRLKLKQSAVNISIVGISQITSAIDSKCEVDVKSLNSYFSTTLCCYVLPKITEALPTRVVDTKDWNIPENIPLADPNFSKPGEIDMLIGAGVFWHILSDQIIKLKRGLPILRSTSFGWIVSGTFDEPIKKTFCHLSKTVNLSLDDEIRRFWEIEESSSHKSILSHNDLECENHFCKTMVRNDSGRFVVRIPLKHSSSLLGSSLNTAIKRLYQLERKFKSSPTFKQAYSDFMTEYRELGAYVSSRRC